MSSRKIALAFVILMAVTVAVLIGVLGAIKLEGRAADNRIKAEENRWKDIEACLPENIKLSSPLSSLNRLPTVKDKLTEVGAYAKDGKLFDNSGKEIRFYSYIDGRGYMPGNPDYEKEVQKHGEAIRELQKTYTVIVLAFIMI